MAVDSPAPAATPLIALLAPMQIELDPLVRELSLEAHDDGIWRGATADCHVFALLTTMVDFSDTGEIGLLIDQGHVVLREATIGNGGILPGKELAFTFGTLLAVYLSGLGLGGGLGSIVASRVRDVTTAPRVLGSSVGAAPHRLHTGSAVCPRSCLQRQRRRPPRRRPCAVRRGAPRPPDPGPRGRVPPGPPPPPRPLWRSTSPIVIRPMIT